MNIVEKLLEYRNKRDVSLLGCSSEFEAENLIVIVTEILSWLKLERKRELWIEQGRKNTLKPMNINPSFPWCRDLLKLVCEDSIIAEVFSVEGNCLQFRNDISEEYRREARRIADEKYNPQMVIG